MSNIISLFGPRPSATPADNALRNPSFDYIRPTLQPQLKRNRNSPYRKLWYAAESGFVQLNKVGCQYTDQEIKWIQEGVEAAHTLAREMAAAAERILPKGRRSRSEALEHRREFKAAMRQRIRDIAAARDLSDEEIKPALTLKHHVIACFCEQYGVNIEWLLEGKGRIFESDPITINPNMTGRELATVVGQMPKADQQMIEAMVDRILRERGL